MIRNNRRDHLVTRMQQYTSLVSPLLALSTGHVSAAGIKADRIVIHKQSRALELMRAGGVLKTYKVALGGEPVGPRTRQGDHHSPEGVYLIDIRNVNSSIARCTFPIPMLPSESVPRKRGEAFSGGRYLHSGPPQRLGGRRPSGPRTDAAIAVTDKEIEQIWQLVDNGTPVEILP